MINVRCLTCSRTLSTCVCACGRVNDPGTGLHQSRAPDGQVRRGKQAGGGRDVACTGWTFSRRHNCRREPLAVGIGLQSSRPATEVSGQRMPFVSRTAFVAIDWHASLLWVAWSGRAAMGLGAHGAWKALTERFHLTWALWLIRSLVCSWPLRACMSVCVRVREMYTSRLFSPYPTSSLRSSSTIIHPIDHLLLPRRFWGSVAVNPYFNPPSFKRHPIGSYP